MDNDHYAILDLPKNASEADIKKAYRKLALIWHPDKNNSLPKSDVENRFKQINHAYMILSDPIKRQHYDQYNADPSDNAVAFDPFETFDQLFKDDAIPPVIVHVDCSMYDTYHGILKTLSFKRYGPCEHCDGMGTQSKQYIKCKVCKGNGMMIETSKGGKMGFLVNQKKCNICNGIGIDPEEPLCKTCEGMRYDVEEAEYDLVIPAGSHNKQIITLDNEGNYIPIEDRNIDNNYQDRTDVMFIISTPDKETINGIEYKRGVYIEQLKTIDHYNLLIEYEITLAESLCGFYKEIKTIDNTTISIKNEQLLINNQLMILPNKGMKKNDGTYGDLLIRFKIIDMTLDKIQKRRIWQILTNTGYNKDMQKDGDQLISFDEWIKSNNSSNDP